MQTYERVAVDTWVEPDSGCVVQSIEGRYVAYRPAMNDFMVWAETQGNLWMWMPLQPRARMPLEIWVNGIIGLIIFIWTAAIGYAALGVFILMFFLAWGVFCARLRTKHPVIYAGLTIATVISLFKLP